MDSKVQELIKRRQSDEDMAATELTVEQLAPVLSAEFFAGWLRRTTRDKREVAKLMAEHVIQHEAQVRTLWKDLPLGELEQLSALNLFIYDWLLLVPRRPSPSVATKLSTVVDHAERRALLVGLWAAALGKRPTGWRALVRRLKAYKLPPALPEDAREQSRERLQSFAESIPGLSGSLAEVAAAVIATNSSPQVIGRLREVYEAASPQHVRQLDAFRKVIQNELRFLLGRRESVRAAMVPIEHLMFRAMLIGFEFQGRRAAG